MNSTCLKSRKLPAYIWKGRLPLVLCLICSGVAYSGTEYLKPEGSHDNGLYAQKLPNTNSKLLPGLILLPGRGIFFRPGATMEEVALVMGPPTQKKGYLWYYGDSIVQFSRTVRVPVVTGYEINATPLRIYDKDPFFTP